MIAELLTPLMLATAPVEIKLPEPLQYSHEYQSHVLKEGQVAQYYPRQTVNGTRTFDWQGRPNDSDND